MKLTNQQIAKIEETLWFKRVYDDIKIELIDHIASEIEEKYIMKRVLKLLSQKCLINGNQIKMHPFLD
jgi:hypothetical protein